MLVAELHDLDDRPRDGGGGALGVVPAGDDPVEEFAALAELHDEVDGIVVLTGLAERHDARALRQVAHDGDLAAHVLDVHGCPELPLRDALTREQLARVAVDAEVRHAELAAPELAVHEVPVLDVLFRHAGKHRDRGLLLGGGGGGATSAALAVVGVGEARFDVLAGHSGRGSAAVAHGSRDRGGGEVL